MKINKKIFIIVCVIFIILIPNIRYTSMVELDDETADKQLKINQEKWEKEQEEKINKSSNNYLKYITIDNYELTPTFNKQTINYKIKEEIKEHNIIVRAETEDDKASVSGIGDIILEDDGENIIKIEVTAENGMVRTYYIMTAKKATNNAGLDNMEYNKKVQVTNDIDNIKVSKDDNKIDKNMAIIITISAAIIIIISIYVYMKNKAKENNMHKRKH